MSSILEALKKLERENKGDNPEEGPVEDPGFSWPVPVDAKDAHSSRLKKKLGTAPLIGFFIFMVVLGGGALIFWNDLKPDTAAGKNKIAPMEPLMEKMPVPQSGYAPINAPAGTLNPNVPVEAAKPPEQYRHVSEREMPGKGDESADDTYGTDKVSNGRELKQEVISPTLDKETTEMIAKIPKDMIPPKKLADSKWLTLQGISWSKIPQARVAVINSQILKEGRRVDGALVMRIDKDYVVVEKDGEQYMVPFNHH